MQTEHTKFHDPKYGERRKLDCRLVTALGLTYPTVRVQSKYAALSEDRLVVTIELVSDEAGEIDRAEATLKRTVYR